MEKSYKETYNQVVPDDWKGDIDIDFSRLGENDDTAFVDFDGNDNRIGFSIQRISIRL